MRRIALIFMLCATPVLGQNWQTLDNAGIQAVLTGQTVDYENAWQEFLPSGRTLYNAGEDSWGYWEVRGEQYCSQWPPADGWACYDVERDGQKVRFIGESGHATFGTVRN
ncbi:hypothetical protein [uncultured Shimia sp.]|uniref:hypothetical protein n=1 Tax=uncultured Shimia sp. TaxID=573152 RepID=UPI002627A07F|nr:hypothetical protein [uncultured Shimia sp.]